MSKKKAQYCKVCGKQLILDKSKVYSAAEPIGLLESLTSVRKTYDVIDCDYCGCQNLLNIRLPKAAVLSGDEDNEGESEEESEKAEPGDTKE